MGASSPEPLGQFYQTLYKESWVKDSDNNNLTPFLVLDEAENECFKFSVVYFCFYKEIPLFNIGTTFI